jgi:pimeloyl-ACP methyl ester carboxylesterase
VLYSRTCMTKSSIIFFLLLISLPIYAQLDSIHYFKSFDGTKIAYQVKGEGEPVLLVHGFIVNGESWKRSALYTDLLHAGYKVIILDQRGNGKSDKPHNDEAYANDAEAKDIMGLMKKIGVKKYNVVGYSRGSIIAARLLALDKNVKRAVLGGIGLGFTDPEWSRRKMFYRALMGDSIPELQAMVKNVQTSGLDQQALAYLQKEQPSTSKDDLARVKQPVLVLCGTNDSDQEEAEQLATIFKNGRFGSMPGDHGAAVRTNEFSQQIIEFLKKTAVNNR